MLSCALTCIDIVAGFVLLLQGGTDSHSLGFCFLWNSHRCLRLIIPESTFYGLKLSFEYLLDNVVEASRLIVTQNRCYISMADTENITVASNVLGTIGTVLWCIQLIPQIWYNWKQKKTDGLPPSMMFLWASCMLTCVVPELDC